MADDADVTSKAGSEDNMKLLPVPLEHMPWGNSTKLVVRRLATLKLPCCKNHVGRPHGHRDAQGIPATPALVEECPQLRHQAREQEVSDSSPSLSSTKWNRCEMCPLSPAQNAYVWEKWCCHVCVWEVKTFVTQQYLTKTRESPNERHDHEWFLLCQHIPQVSSTPTCGGFEGQEGIRWHKKFSLLGFADIFTIYSPQFPF